MTIPGGNPALHSSLFANFTLSQTLSERKPYSTHGNDLGASVGLRGGLAGGGSGGFGGGGTSRDVSWDTSWDTRGGTARWAAGWEGTRRSCTGAATAGAGVGVHDTTILTVGSSGDDGVAGSGIHSKADPGKDTIGDVVAEEDVFDDWVDTAGSLFAEDGVVSVIGDILGVGAVGCNGLDLGDEVLVEEDLADVGDDTASDGVVAKDGGILVGEDVDVSGTAGVVTGEDGVECCDTVGVCLLETTEESLVDVGKIAGVTVATGNDTRVYTGRVAMPPLEEDFRNRLAGVDVDDLNVDGHRNTLLILGNVLADILAGNVVRALGNFGSKDAGSVVGEENRWVGVDSDVSEVGLVVSGQDGVEITGPEIRALWRNALVSKERCEIGMREGVLTVDATLLPELVGVGIAAGNGQGSLTTSLELLSTVGKGALVDRN